MLKCNIDSCLADADEKRRNDKFLPGVQPISTLILKRARNVKITIYTILCHLLPYILFPMQCLGISSLGLND